MTIQVIGTQFPQSWVWAKYEQEYMDSLLVQIGEKFSTQRNLFINLTWFGPQFDNGEYAKIIEFNQQGRTFDNLFLLSTVDPAMMNKQQITNMVDLLGNPTLYKLGNFDTDYHFNFFAPVLARHFKQYTEEELLLTNPEILYINYNRKPRQHRVDFVKKLINEDLFKLGVVTLGKPDVLYDKDKNNDLFITINEDPKKYVEYGHWYDTDKDDQFGIPHDVLSLHNMNYWSRHFLNLIGATEFFPWDDIFVSEPQFKPIIGLRPFIINGNVRTYQWYRDNGFRTFNQYFNGIELENIPEFEVHNSIINVLKYLSALSKEELLAMYADMLPDLQHNRARFFEYAREQEYKINHLFNA